MKIFILLGHPNINSFNVAIAENCKQQLVENGHSYFFHDLYREYFNPVEFRNKMSGSQDQISVTEYGLQLKQCNGIIVIHPNWWGQPPAIIKGWIERVFIPGVTHEFETLPDGTRSIKGLLKDKRAMIINTSNTSYELENTFYNDPLETLWKNRIFGFCGVEKFNRLNFNVIIQSSEQQRSLWLKEVRDQVNVFFPKI